ncbi:MAG: hypothetical protein LVQ95_03085 [Candidatus Micrarchaeales archaeon]|nr:hypothetical protein [Candidatus Micrarchaeales archaeon]
MIKKIVYVGLIFLAAALIIFLVSGSISSAISQNLQGLSLTQNLTIPQKSFSFVAMPLTNASTFYIAVGNFTKPLNVYLFNNSAFLSWKGSLTGNTPANPLAAAVGLEGKGAFFIYNSVTVATIPAYLGSANITPLYSTSLNKTYAAGNYYFVMDNTNGISSSMSVNATVAYLPPLTNSSLKSGAFANIGSEFQQEVYLGVFFFIFLVVGVVVIVWGIMKKPKSEAEAPAYGWKPAKKDEVNPNYVNQLYKNVGRSGTGRGARRRPAIKRAGKKVRKRRGKR